VLRRMSLVGDAMAHAVLPGAAAGFLLAGLSLPAMSAGGLVAGLAVALAAGNTPQITLNPLESVQTMTAYIVQVSQGDTPAGTIEYRTIFAVGLALFVSTMFLNVLAQWLVGRLREKYE